MKIKSIKNITKCVVFFLSVISTISCSCLQHVQLPKVKNATYQPYNINGEKGYDVAFELSDNAAVPEYVVINKIKRSITFNDKDGLKYKVNVIAQTTNISNYKVEGSDKENGIFFTTNNGEVFKKIEFTLIK